jgi:hypothetical protein
VCARGSNRALLCGPSTSPLERTGRYAVGLVIFFAIALASAVSWHTLLPHYRAASIGATVTTVVAFQVVNFVLLGYLDPFFLVAAVTTSAVALFVSFLVGLPFRNHRRQRSGDASAL